MEEITFEIFGVTFGEPITMLTDVIVGIVGVRAFIIMNRLKTDSPGFRLFKWFFLLMGVATAVSGIIGHGLIYSLHVAWKLPGWIISMFSIMSIERASIVQAGPYVKRSILRVLKIANIIELCFFIGITILTTLGVYEVDFNPFYFVGIHSAYGLAVVVMPLQYYVVSKEGHIGNKLIAWSATLSILAAVVYELRISIHPVWFSYYDFAHIIMAICLHIVFLGAKRLYTDPDRPPEIDDTSLI